MADDATSNTTEAVLDLDGFTVLAVGDYGGELEVLIETTATIVHCGRCGRRANAHARREQVLRDIPVSGRPVVLVWTKRIWRCRAVACTCLASRIWLKISWLKVGFGLQGRIAMNFDGSVEVEGLVRADMVEHVPVGLALAGEVGEVLDLVPVELFVLQ